MAIDRIARALAYRTLTSADRTISVKGHPYNAVGDGTTDDTAALQAAIDSGARAVFIPPGTYLISSLLMPNVFGFHLFGIRGASIIKAKSGGSNAVIRWDTAAIAYNEQHVSDLTFTMTSGAQHGIDTSGAGGPTLARLYFTDVPSGKSAIYINGAAATYCHDARVIDCQVYYGSVGGHSGIRLGPLSADTIISDFIMNGGCAISYCLFADIGAKSCNVIGGHPYNAAVNVVRMAGENDDFGFVGCDIDSAQEHTVTMDVSDLATFTGCRFRATNSGYSAVNITGTCNAVTFSNGKWDGEAGAVSCVAAEATTSNVTVFSGAVDTIGNFSNPFDLLGDTSFARGIAGYNSLGLAWSHVGVQASAQAQSTTQYLGAGSSATEGNAGYMVPQDSRCVKVFIATDETPAAGQTFKFRARKNGTNIGTELTISNGGYGGTITLGTDFAQYNLLTISSVFSATSGAATVRWVAEFEG